MRIRHCISAIGVAATVGLWVVQHRIPHTGLNSAGVPVTEVHMPAGSPPTCPLAFSGDFCEAASSLPACVGGVFQGYLTVTRETSWPGLDEHARLLLPEKVRKFNVSSLCVLETQLSMLSTAGPFAPGRFRAPQCIYKGCRSIVCTGVQRRISGRHTAGRRHRWL